MLNCLVIFVFTLAIPADLPASVRPIGAVDLTGDGTLVAAGRGALVCVYDTRSRREVAVLQGGQGDIVQSVRFTPDGKRLAAGGFEWVTVWEVPADVTLPWAVPKRMGPSVGRVLAIDFSPDGRWMATGGGEASRSGEVRLWDVASGKLVWSLDHLHADTVMGVRFSPDGSKLATASADRLLKVVRSADGQEWKTCEGHGGHVLAVDWSGDGKQLATGGADGLVKLWDGESGELVRTLAPAGKQVTAVRWVAGKPLVVGASGDGSVRFWNPTGPGNITRTLAGPRDYLYGLATTRDGKLVAAGGAEGILFLWDGDDGRLLHRIEPPPLIRP